MVERSGETKDDVILLDNVVSTPDGADRTDADVEALSGDAPVELSDIVSSEEESAIPPEVPVEAPVLYTDGKRLIREGDSSPWPRVALENAFDDDDLSGDTERSGNLAETSSAAGNGNGNNSGTGNTGDEDEEDDEDGDEESSMSLLEHLGELRRRLVRGLLAVLVAFFLCYGFAKELFYYLSLPLLQVMPADAKFIYTGVAEGFFVDLKVSIVAAIFVACPFLFYQIWAFIAPGLYEEEKKYVVPLSFCSAIFFLGGATFCYVIVFPFAFTFFMGYSTDNIVAMLSINEYLSFSLKMLIAFGLIFEMPLFTFFLSRMGIVTAARMRKARKFAVLGVFVIAAILTPPDVFSQIMMACPMILLYEASILVAVVCGKKRAEKAAEAEDKEKEGDAA